MPSYENFDEVATKVEECETLAQARAKWYEPGRRESIRVYDLTNPEKKSEVK